MRERRDRSGSRTRRRTRRVVAGLGATLLVVLLQGVACGPPPSGKVNDPWAEDADRQSEIDGDLDRAEMRWRREIARSRHQDEEDMRLLTDDPAQDPSEYGQVVSENGDPAEGSRPLTGWDLFKSRARTFGRATFAFMTVAITLGMMVAPYFTFM